MQNPTWVVWVVLIWLGPKTALLSALQFAGKDDSHWNQTRLKLCFCVSVAGSHHGRFLFPNICWLFWLDWFSDAVHWSSDNCPHHLSGGPASLWISREWCRSTLGHSSHVSFFAFLLKEQNNKVLIYFIHGVREASNNSIICCHAFPFLKQPCISSANPAWRSEEPHQQIPP